MSGLTPILDTLLHQVLGKRGDVLSGLQKQPGQTASLVQGAHTVRGPETETRPEPRFVKPAPGSLLRTTEGQIQRPLPTPFSSLPALLFPEEPGESARITLSASARLISSLMKDRGEGKYVIRPERAPVTSADKLPTTQQLAQRLGDIVRESGLFYESHLAKWYAGRMPTGELAREPQMQMAWVLGSGLGQPKSAVGTLPHFRKSLQGESREGQPVVSSTSPRNRLPVIPSSSVSVRSAEMNDEADANLVRLRADEDLSGLLHPREAREKLAAIVRHQLELLGSPNIRWEGELVNGLFMMMEIQLPENSGRESGQSGEKKDKDDSWSATFHIALPVLGNLKVSVQQTEEKLSVGIVAEKSGTVSLLKKQTETVEERLRARGVEKPFIAISSVRDNPQKTG